MTLFAETADVSVRPAVAGDEHHVAAIQLAAWRADHAHTLGDAVTALDPETIQASWAEAIASPPSREHRVLVACAGPRVVGFAAVRPAGVETGELLALEVAPPDQRAGHGSRLLAAAVDLLREDGATSLTAWVLDGDVAREQFYAGAGLGPDGRARTLAAGERTVTERRWAADITQPAP